MKKLLFFIIGLAILAYIGYKYFDLNQRPEFLSALKSKDYKSAEVIAKDAVFSKVQTKAKEYFNTHNNYFVSKSNNVCTSIQSFFTRIQDITSNPVECSAREHTFTARVRSNLTKTSFCLDQTGFYTTSLEEPNFEEGVRCK